MIERLRTPVCTLPPWDAVLVTWASVTADKLSGGCLPTAGANTTTNDPTGAATDVEAGEGAGKAPTHCLVVHPDNAFACAARLSMEHQLLDSPSLASAWSASLSRGPSTKLEGDRSGPSVSL